MLKKLTALFLMPIVTAIAIAAARALPLVEAVKQGDATAMHALLLQRPQDVNAAEVDGTTALHWAVHRDDLAAVEALIRAGANPKVANRYGVMPLALAAENGNAAVIERLIEAGADVRATLPGGRRSRP